MSEPHTIKRFIGLYGSVNPISGRIAEGAMDIAENVVIRSTEVVEPRRGYTATAAPTTKIDAFTFSGGVPVGISYATATTAGSLSKYDSASNSWTSIAMSPGNQLFDRPAGDPTYATRFVSTNKATYFQSRYGLTKIENLSASTCRPAIMPKPWADQIRAVYGQHAVGIVNSAPAWLANNCQVAYRVTNCRFGANNELIESEPSDRVVVSNTSGSAGYVVFGISTSWMTSTDSFWRPYRSKQVAVGSDPSDEMFLVAEVAANTGAPFTSDGYCHGGGSGINYSDQTPDSALYVPCPTNPITGDGITSANTPAPLSADIAWFKSRMYYLGTTDVQRIVIKVIGTGTGGIVDGAWIKIGDATFNFRNTAYWAPNDVQVYTGGTVSQNIENTARHLVASINNYFGAGPSNYGPTAPTSGVYQGGLSGALCAYYVSGSGNDAGQVLIESILPGASPFTVQTSSRAGWGTDDTTATSSDPNAQPAGLMWSNLDQPEGVPTANSTIVGDASAAGQRIIPLRDALFIFKKDGLYRVTDDGSVLGPKIELVDPTIRLLAPQTAVTLDNVILALCDQGVLLISENGSVTNVSHNQIERDLLKLVATVGADTFAARAFAVANQPQHEYILAIPEASNATCCTKQYVLNLQTEAWTSWSLPGVIAGAVHPDTGRLYWSLASRYSYTFPSFWIERKNGDSTDYQDPGFSLNGWSFAEDQSLTKTLTYDADLTTGAYRVEVGDYIEEANYSIPTFSSARVTGVSYSTATGQTTVTTDRAQNWDSGYEITLRKAIQARVRFLPIYGPDPLVTKHWGDAYLAFRYLDADFASLTWNSDASPYSSNMTAIEPIASTQTSSGGAAGPITIGTWGSLPWGSGPWGRQTRDVILKVTMPSEVAYSAQLTPTILIGNALTRFELCAVNIGIMGGTTEVAR